MEPAESADMFDVGGDRREETEMTKNLGQAPETTEFPSTESRTAAGAMAEGFAELVGAIRNSVLDLLV